MLDDLLAVAVDPVFGGGGIGGSDAAAAGAGGDGRDRERPACASNWELLYTEESESELLALRHQRLGQEVGTMPSPLSGPHPPLHQRSLSSPALGAPKSDAPLPTSPLTGSHRRRRVVHRRDTAWYYPGGAPAPLPEALLKKHRRAWSDVPPSPMVVKRKMPAALRPPSARPTGVWVSLVPPVQPAKRQAWCLDMLSVLLHLYDAGHLTQCTLLASPRRPRCMSEDSALVAVNGDSLTSSPVLCSSATPGAPDALSLSASASDMRSAGVGASGLQAGAGASAGAGAGGDAGLGTDANPQSRSSGNRLDETNTKAWSRQVSREWVQCDDASIPAADLPSVVQYLKVHTDVAAHRRLAATCTNTLAALCDELRTASVLTAQGAMLLCWPFVMAAMRRNDAPSRLVPVVTPATIRSCFVVLAACASSLRRPSTSSKPPAMPVPPLATLTAAAVPAATIKACNDDCTPPPASPVAPSVVSPSSSAVRLPQLVTASSAASRAVGGGHADDTHSSHSDDGVDPADMAVDMAVVALRCLAFLMEFGVAPATRQQLLAGGVPQVALLTVVSYGPMTDLRRVGLEMLRLVKTSELRALAAHVSGHGDVDGAAAAAAADCVHCAGASAAPEWVQSPQCRRVLSLAAHSELERRSLRHGKHAAAVDTDAAAAAAKAVAAERAQRAADFKRRQANAREKLRLKAQQRAAEKQAEEEEEQQRIQREVSAAKQRKAAALLAKAAEQHRRRAEAAAAEKRAREAALARREEEKLRREEQVAQATESWMRRKREDAARRRLLRQRDEEEKAHRAQQRAAELEQRRQQLAAKLQQQRRSKRGLLDADDAELAALS